MLVGGVGRSIINAACSLPRYEVAFCFIAFQALYQRNTPLYQCAAIAPQDTHQCILTLVGGTGSIITTAFTLLRYMRLPSSLAWLPVFSTCW